MLVDPKAELHIITSSWSCNYSYRPHAEAILLVLRTSMGAATAMAMMTSHGFLVTRYP